MIYVDYACIPWRGRLWCHMMTDGAEEELHNFAARIGLKREWFQGDHYDVTVQRRTVALEQGARPASSAFLIGLRREQRERSLSNG